MLPALLAVVAISWTPNAVLLPSAQPVAAVHRHLTPLALLPSRPNGAWISPVTTPNRATALECVKCSANNQPSAGCGSTCCKSCNCKGCDCSCCCSCRTCDCASCSCDACDCKSGCCQNC